MADSPAIRAGKAFVDRMESAPVQEQNRLKIFSAVWRCDEMQAEMKAAASTLEAKRARKFKKYQFPDKDEDWLEWMQLVAEILGLNVNQETIGTLELKLKAQYWRRQYEPKVKDDHEAGNDMTAGDSLAKALDEQKSAEEKVRVELNEGILKRLLEPEKAPAGVREWLIPAIHYTAKAGAQPGWAELSREIGGPTDRTIAQSPWFGNHQKFRAAIREIESPTSAPPPIRLRSSSDLEDSQDD